MATARLAELRDVLIDHEEPITKRMRAVFYLRTIGTPDVVPILVQGFSTDSELLQHEICYVLGQTGLREAEEFLITVLRNENLAAISRHEAAEALGAIGNGRYIDLLIEFSQSPIQEIAETCQLALDRLEWLKSNEK